MCFYRALISPFRSPCRKKTFFWALPKTPRKMHPWVYLRAVCADSLWWLHIAIHCLFVMGVKIYFFLHLEVIAMYCQERQRRLSLSWRKFSIFVSNEHRLRYSLWTSKGPLHLNHLFQEHWWRLPLFVVAWKLSERIIATSITTAPSLSAPSSCLY